MIFPEGKPEGWNNLSPVAQKYLETLSIQAEPVDKWDSGSHWLYPDLDQYTELLLTPKQTLNRINAAIAASLESRSMYPDSPHPPLIQRGWQELEKFITTNKQELAQNEIMIFVANLSFENDPDLPFPEIVFFALQESDPDFSLKIREWCWHLDETFYEIRGINNPIEHYFPTYTTLEGLYKLSQDLKNEEYSQLWIPASSIFYSSRAAATVLYGYPYFTTNSQVVSESRKEILGLCASTPIIAAEVCMELEYWSSLPASPPLDS
jgi:hypothetical protein